MLKPVDDQFSGERVGARLAVLEGSQLPGDPGERTEEVLTVEVEDMLSCFPLIMTIGIYSIGIYSL